MTCCQDCLDKADKITARLHPVSELFLPQRLSVMVVCVECGNKRCPKATDHRFACTGSNEPGQAGSAY